MYKNDTTSHSMAGTGLAAVVLMLLTSLLAGCVSGYDVDAASADDTEGQAYVSLSFINYRGTRATAPVTDQGLLGVHTEGSTLNESQIHTVLIALFDPIGDDATRRLRYLYWFADDEAPLLSVLSDATGTTITSLSTYGAGNERVMGQLSFSSVSRLSTSSTKMLLPGHYMAAVYGNLMSPQLLKELLGLSSVSNLLTMTQQQVQAKDIRLSQFRTLFSRYATGPLSTGSHVTVPTAVGTVMLMGGRADNTDVGDDYYQQSFCEVEDFHITKGYSQANPLKRTFELKRQLAKIRLNMTNIDETGEVYGGTTSYWLNADAGIVVKNWIPYGPTTQWTGYSVGTASAYTFTGKDGTSSATGYHDLNVSWMQRGYPAQQSLQYYLTTASSTWDDGGTPRTLNVQTGAIDGAVRSTTQTGGYNAELFNCYIAPWSSLFGEQTSTQNVTTLLITLEERDASNNPVAGSARTYEVPIYNPNASGSYTILPNYLYQIDAVFMGKAGLRWKIKAEPDGWTDDPDENLDLGL